MFANAVSRNSQERVYDRHGQRPASCASVQRNRSFGIRDKQGEREPLPLRGRLSLDSDFIEGVINESCESSQAAFRALLTDIKSRALLVV
jgi:hypothetical protein